MCVYMHLVKLDLFDVDQQVEDEDALPPKNGFDRATLCHAGNHELILDEQVGLRCAFCSYIKMEIKYILPSFVSHAFFFLFMFILNY